MGGGGGGEEEVRAQLVYMYLSRLRVLYCGGKLPRSRESASVHACEYREGPREQRENSVNGEAALPR